MSLHASAPAPSSAPSTAQIREAWDALAPGFDAHLTPHSIAHGEEVLRRVEIRPGLRVLDVAAGTGALSIPAARRGATVLATDLSATMIDRLHARADAEGLSTLEGAVGDFHALDLADDSFDLVASLNGVTMSPQLAVGLMEMVRVTRPGGAVLVAAFGPLPKVEFLAFFLGALAAAVPGADGLPAQPPPPFQLARPDVMQSRLEEVGLTGITVETITCELPVESAAQLWDNVVSSNPLGARMGAQLSEGQRADVLGVLDGLLRERSGGHPGAVLHLELNVGIGVKPVR